MSKALLDEWVPGQTQRRLALEAGVRQHVKANVDGECDVMIAVFPKLEKLTQNTSTTDLDFARLSPRACLRVDALLRRRKRRRKDTIFSLLQEDLIPSPSTPLARKHPTKWPRVNWAAVDLSYERATMPPSTPLLPVDNLLPITPLRQTPDLHQDVSSATKNINEKKTPPKGQREEDDSYQRIRHEVQSLGSLYTPFLIFQLSTVRTLFQGISSSPADVGASL